MGLLRLDLVVTNDFERIGETSDIDLGDGKRNGAWFTLHDSMKSNCLEMFCSCTLVVNGASVTISGENC